MAKKITVTSRVEAVKTRNAALARRLESGQVNGGGTRDLPLVTPERWHTYLANTYDNPNALWEMKELGWVPLEAADLTCKPEECGFRLSPDNYIVRGPQSQEMLFKMDADDYRLLEQARTAANLRGIGSQSKAKSDMAEAIAGQHGDEAASWVSGLQGEVIDRIAGTE